MTASPFYHAPHGSGELVKPHHVDGRQLAHNARHELGVRGPDLPDPPFNSNRTYSAPIGSQAAGAAFKDTWTLDDVDAAWHGEIAEQNPAMYSVIGAAGEAHGKGMKSYLIMMAVRLLEMRRILKPSGSIYLHCDPTASHYLKMLMDAIFGIGKYHSEIIWRRYGSHNDAKRYGRVHDVLLFYGKSSTGTWNGAWSALDKSYITQAYRHADERGCPGLGNLDTEVGN